MSKRIDLSGKRFGKLLVLGFAAKRLGHALWNCQCDCGTISTHWSASLRRGHSRSCGCWRGELVSIGKGRHRRSGTKMYWIWQAMLDRCRNPKNKKHADYGGRGIEVCNRWSLFENFIEDMGERPTEKHTLDRRDNDGNYCKENCRWSTQSEQANNRRGNLLCCIAGVTKTATEWCRIKGIKWCTFSMRYYQKGWPIDDAILRPVRSKKPTSIINQQPETERTQE